MSRDRTIWWALAVVTLIAIGGRMPATGQTPDVLPALLSEVRGLRSAIEQLAGAAPRVQLAMGRLQLQEQRVNTLMRRLDEVRDRLAMEERQAGDQREMLTHFEKAADSNSPNRDEQQQLKTMIAQVKGSLERANAEVQRLRLEESTLVGTIAQEQARWMEINNAVNELDRALGGKR